MGETEHLLNCEKRLKVYALYNSGQINNEQFRKGIEKLWMLNRLKKKSWQALGIPVEGDEDE